MDQELGPLNVGQKLVSKAGAVCRAFNKPRDIRHHKASRIVEVHDAENRVQRCEMIIGDPGLGVTGHGQKRRFADVGESDKADVRDHFQLQEKFQRSRGLSGLGIFGRLHCRRRVMHIAVSASAAFQDQIFPAVAGHIRDHFAACGFPDDGPLGHLDDHVLALFAGASALLAGFTVLSLVFADVAEIRQGVETLVHFENDASAVAAVAAVRTARRDIFFSAKRYVSVAAFSAAHDDLRFIYKHVFVTPHAFAFVFCSAKDFRQCLDACLKSLHSSVFPAVITAEPRRGEQKLSSCPYLRAQSEGCRLSAHTECHRRRCLRSGRGECWCRAVCKGCCRP